MGDEGPATTGREGGEEVSPKQTWAIDYDSPLTNPCPPKACHPSQEMYSGGGPPARGVGRAMASSTAMPPSRKPSSPPLGHVDLPYPAWH